MGCRSSAIITPERSLFASSASRKKQRSDCGWSIGLPADAPIHGSDSRADNSTTTNAKAFGLGDSGCYYEGSCSGRKGGVEGGGERSRIDEANDSLSGLGEVSRDASALRQAEDGVGIALGGDVFSDGARGRGYRGNSDSNSNLNF